MQLSRNFFSDSQFMRIDFETNWTKVKITGTKMRSIAIEWRQLTNFHKLSNVDT